MRMIHLLVYEWIMSYVLYHCHLPGPRRRRIRKINESHRAAACRAAGPEASPRMPENCACVDHCRKGAGLDWTAQQTEAMRDFLDEQFCGFGEETVGKQDESLNDQ